jgi:hypothetical protein
VRYTVHISFEIYRALFQWRLWFTCSCHQQNVMNNMKRCTFWKYLVRKEHSGVTMTIFPVWLVYESM